MLSEKFLTNDPEEQGFAPLSADDKGETEPFADGSLGIAKAVGDDDDDEAIRHRKDYFCFCCCDYRRAVIVVNAIALGNLALLLPGIPAYAAVLAYRGIASEETARAVVAIALVAGIAFHAGGIYGAKTYEARGIRLAAVAHFANTFARCFGLFALVAFPEYYREVGDAYGSVVAQMDGTVSAEDAADLFYDGMMIGAAGGVLLNGFYFQAHLKLLGLMKQGIITPQNYPNVSGCCCD